MREFCVEVDGSRRRDLEVTDEEFSSCYDYHTWLSENKFPSIDHTIVVNKPGSKHFLKKFGDATPGIRKP